jgi:hypothetical protein
MKGPDSGIFFPVDDTFKLRIFLLGLKGILGIAGNM